MKRKLRDFQCAAVVSREKNKQKAPYEVGKMDKHIVRGDEVGNDDDSLDDNHAESGMRVAENVQKTGTCCCAECLPSFFI